MLPITRITMFMAAMLALQAGLAGAQGGAPPPSAPAPEVVVPPEGGSSMSFEVKGNGSNGAGPDVFAHPLFDEKVTLDFKNADIQNVLRLVAAKTGLNILLDPDEVEGQITLHLEDVKLGNALDNILRVRKLAYIVEEGEIVRIVPESRVGRAEIETTTQIIELNWRDAEDMEKTFTNFLTTHGSIKANTESQSLIITDVPPTVTKIRELISGIDRPDRQVVIEARLVDMQIGAQKTFENQWSVARASNQRFRGESTTTIDGEGTSTETTIENILEPIAGVTPILEDGAGVNGGLGVLQFGAEVGIFGNKYLLDATLTALENRSQVQVLANPRVTTLNNIPANIEIIQRVPYVQGTVAGPGGNTVLTIEFEKVGETIKVKPIITPDGHVRLDIDLLQRIFRGRAGAGQLDPPIIDDRSSKSTVIVQDQNTVVLGGLRRRQGNDRIDGVPWMHRIPLIGWAFKDKNYDQTRTELVLMITPDIVEEALLNDREKELYDQIDVQWGVPDYFNDKTQNDLDTLGTPNCNPLEEHAHAAE